MTPPNQGNTPKNINGISVIDLFCGVGGLTQGFVREGFSVAAGFDSDETCRYPYEINNKTPFIRKDIRELKSAEIQQEYSKGSARVLVGCAPCQPFSTYNQKNDDPQWKLLGEFGRLVGEILPEIVSMENVPRLINFRGGQVFNNFIKTLERCGYSVWWDQVYCPDYLAPQSRTRLVLLASRLGQIELEPPIVKKENYRTVRNAIFDLPPLAAGQIDENDPLHRVSRLSELNLKRIRASLPGKSWRDWDSSLITACHRRNTGRGYASVYGRMSWNAPSPTITTQFFGFGNGRFGHPTQDRAISIREGAILQTFPREYKFIQRWEDFSFKKIGKLIGNAVPVVLGQAIARSVKNHLR